MISGINEAKRTIENIDKLSVVKLRNEQKKWHIIELNNEKLLLIRKKDSKENEFKIVEYKDVDFIVVKNKVI